MNHPRNELSNYLNGAINKKNYKKEQLNRSRGASFDIRDPNSNYNNIEKKNKRLEDYFKKDIKKVEIIKNEKNFSSEKSGGTKDSEKKLLNSEITNKKKNNQSNNTQGKKLNNLSLFNFNSGISNNSNSLFLNNSFSFNKNNIINTSKISLDDSLSLTGLFSTPISDLNENEEDKKFISAFHFPSIKCVQSKKKKPFDRFKDKLVGTQQMKIKKYLKKENDEEIKELRDAINSSFYGDEKDKIDNLKKHKNKIDIPQKKEKINNNIKKDKNILIFKTPNKSDKENKDENIIENIGINGIKKNLNFLFGQKVGI